MPIVEGTRRSGFAERATSGRGPTPSRHLALGCRQDYGPAPTWAARSHLSLAYAEQERFWKQKIAREEKFSQRPNTVGSSTWAEHVQQQRETAQHNAIKHLAYQHRLQRADWRERRLSQQAGSMVDPVGGIPTRLTGKKQVPVVSASAAEFAATAHGSPASATAHAVPPAGQPGPSHGAAARPGDQRPAKPPPRALSRGSPHGRSLPSARREREFLLSPAPTPRLLPRTDTPYRHVRSVSEQRLL